MSGETQSQQGRLGPDSASLSEFIRSLRGRMRPIAPSTPLPGRSNADLREVVDDGHLAERFAAEAVAAGCTVHRTGEDGWIETVRDILRGHSARKIIVQPQTATALTGERAAALRRVLEADGVAVVTERDDETLFGADAGVTGVVAAIAETGTIVCASGPESARGMSLIPPVHVVVVDETQIVGDLFDYFEQLERTAGVGLPANINMITGPSKTADIEGILVTGVHGPGAVHIVLTRQSPGW